MCLISSNPNIRWNPPRDAGTMNGLDYISITPKDQNGWDSSLIGGGWRGLINGIDWIPYNKAIINDDYFTFTGNGSVLSGFSDILGSTYYELGFNNVQFSNGHATIDFAASSFTLPETDGEFTLNNASAYNNKYAILVAVIATTPPITSLYGFKDATSASALKGYKIEGGTVKIPVFKLTAGDTYFNSYSGSQTVDSLVLIIMDGENFDYAHYAANITSYKYLLFSNGMTDNRVIFTNGKANKNAGDGTPVGF